MSRYPTLRYKASRKFYYCWDSVAKKKIYLGMDLDIARERFDALVAEDARQAAKDPQPEAFEPVTNLSVNELLFKYLRHRRDSGADFRRLRRLKAATLFVKSQGLQPAGSFRALALQQARTKMLAARDRRHKTDPGSAKPLSRSYINSLIDELKSAWVWAASLEMISAETAHSLGMVKNLRLGKGGREPKLVPAVETTVVEATLPELSPVVAAMVQLQLYAGMRPGELCKLRPRDISTDPKQLITLPNTRRTVGALRCGETVVWLAVPESHKNTMRGKPRAIALGPICQSILKPYLDRKPDAFLFSPREASDWHREQTARRKVYGSRPPGVKYKTESYGRAIKAAVERVNRKRAEAGLEPIADWRPNQLRHRAGTDASERFDRPSAAAFLGHAGVDVIDVYCEQELGKAVKVAAAMG